MNQIKVFEVCTPEPGKQVLLSTLYQDEAERFVRGFYGSTNVVCDIFEYDRTPVDHTKKK